MLVIDRGVVMNTGVFFLSRYYSTFIARLSMFYHTIVIMQKKAFLKLSHYNKSKKDRGRLFSDLLNAAVCGIILTGYYISTMLSPKTKPELFAGVCGIVFFVVLLSVSGGQGYLYLLRKSIRLLFRHHCRTFLSRIPSGGTDFRREARRCGRKASFCQENRIHRGDL